MPRGSKPGERRGGRQKGTPNKSTTLKNAALSAASSNPTASPLEFLLSVMRDPTAPAGLRVQVARAAAPLMHGKPKFGSLDAGAGDHGSFAERGGFTIDIAEAKALRDIDHRLAVFLRKRYAPSENGGSLTAVEIAVEAELEVVFSKRAAALVCPPGYGVGEATKDRNGLHALNCKRLSPPSCGGGNLKGAEDDEEAILTAKLAAYQQSPVGRDQNRALGLTLKAMGEGLSIDEEDELNRIKVKYPEDLTDSPLAQEIALRLVNE